MPRRVKRNYSSSTRKSRRVKRMRRSKKCSGCGCRKRRQSRRSMRGGYNEAALQKVLDAALRGGGYGSGSSGLGGSRLNGGQGGGSRRRTKRARRTRRSRRSMRGGTNEKPACSTYSADIGSCGNTLSPHCMPNPDGSHGIDACIPNPNYVAVNHFHPASASASSATAWKDQENFFSDFSTTPDGDGDEES